VFGAVASLAYLSTAWSLRRIAIRGDGLAGDVLAEDGLADDAAVPTLGRAGVASLFRVRGYPQMLALFVPVTLGLGVLSSMLPFFLATRGLGPTTQTLTLGGLFVTAVLVLPLWIRLARGGGKARAFTGGLLLISSGLLLILTVPTGSVSWPLVVVALLVGAGLATVLLFPWAMLPALVEVDALQHGARREGLLYAVFTFAQKTAFAVGAWLNAQVLGLIGYQPGGSEQSPTAVLGVLLMVGPGAALLFAVAALLAWRYPHHRSDHRAARQTLARRSDPTARR
jgi:GPH family glycoside/pentoside/hexuronide:cation symporter